MGDRTRARQRTYSTINIDPTTKEKLEAIKAREQLRNYNAAIEHLMEESQ